MASVKLISITPHRVSLTGIGQGKAVLWCGPLSKEGAVASQAVYEAENKRYKLGV